MSHFLLVLLLLLICILLPLFYAWRVWHLDEPTFVQWLVVTADAAVFVALLLLIGRWDIAGHFTPAILLAVFAMASAVSLWRHLARPISAGKGPSFWRRHWSTVGSLVLFSAVTVYAVLGRLPSANPVALAFPLEGGRFMVGHGGANMLLNHHAGHRGQQHAVDITAINRFGFRARGVLPDSLDAYVIHGALVVSPCRGEVLALRDGLTDRVPPRRDPDNAAGNHIVIACHGVNVELAHLLADSIAAKVGQTVEVGQHLARVGNSGNTSEPHLHIHAVDPATGEGVPVTFDGRLPLRNTVFDTDPDTKKADMAGSVVDQRGRVAGTGGAALAVHPAAGRGSRSGAMPQAARIR